MNVCTFRFFLLFCEHLTAKGIDKCCRIVYNRISCALQAPAKHGFNYHYTMCNGKENPDDIIMIVANNIYKYYNGRVCTIVDFMHGYDDANENIKQFIQKLDFVPSNA